MSTARRNLLVNLALALGVSLALAALLEGAGRVLEARLERPAREPYLWDWETMWDGDFYTVGSGSLGWPPDEEWNADGLRDRTRPAERRPRTYRLVFLGDSVTLGAGIAASEAYPQVLERRLHALGRRVEVFNVALWGWATRQQRTAYERIVRRYRPDRVVLAVCLNDVAELQNNLARPPGWLQRLYERSALVRVLVDAQGREIRRVEELFERPDAPGVREGLRRFFDEVRALRDAVRADGAEFALIVFPFRFQVAEGAPPPTVQGRITEFCADAGIACVDLLPTLATLGEPAFVDYDHLSPPGARLTAETLLASPLVPAGYAHSLDLADGADADGARLVQVLADADPARREAAAWSVPRRAAPLDPRLREALVERLAADPDAGVRTAAAEALASRPAEARAASPALWAALGDPSRHVRWAAARALAARGEGASADEEIGRLVAALRHDDLYVRAFAAWTLGELGPRAARAVPALVAALQIEGHSRGVAARALANVGPAAHAAVPELAAALGSPEAPRRWNAALAMGLLGAPARAAEPALVARLADPEPRVRAHAARALGRLGAVSVRAVEGLSEALRRDADGDVRAMAARALGRAAPASAARAALQAALDDDVRRVRVEAHKALAALAETPDPAQGGTAR